MGVSKSKLIGRSLTTASISVMSILLSSAVNAQVNISQDCTPFPTDGATVLCDGTITDTITTYVDDITIIVGSVIMPTTVTSNNGDGINVTTSIASVDTTITITEGSSISGADEGIQAQNSGTGNLIITATDTIGLSSQGIDAENDNSAADLTIVSTGVATGSNQGIRAVNNGTGTTSVTVADTSGGGAGLAVSSGNSSLDVIVDSTGTASGGYSGIGVTHRGTGSATITAVDSIGGFGAAIYARNYGTDLSITSTGLADSAGFSNGFGGGVGIRAENFGTGSTSVTAADVRGYYDGIYVHGTTTTTDLSVITTGVVTGGTNGIRTVNAGTGVTAIQVNEVTGGIHGVLSTTSTGAATITLGPTSVVTGTTAEGIDVRSTGGAITVRGSSGDVTGGTDGIYIRSQGGDILVENLDSVTGLAGDGIDVASAGGAITINAVDTITSVPGAAGDLSIRAISSGGEISVQGTGLIDGHEGGILADATGSAAAVGTGGINIGGVTAIGDVTSNGTSDGVAAITDGSGGILIDTTGGDVSGINHGIFASNQGTGITTIRTIDSLASGSLGRGIYVTTNTTAADVTVTSTGSASGSREGIRVLHRGTGLLSVTAVDTMASSGGGTGLYAGGTFDVSGVNVTSTGAAIGGRNGIRTASNGSGDLIITAVDTTGMDVFFGHGIFAINNASGTRDLLVSSTGTAFGGSDGIEVLNFGTGVTSVDAVDSEGARGNGIRAFGFTTTLGGINVTSTGTVTGGTNGIDVDNRGTGAVNVNANVVTSANGTGIRVRNGLNGANSGDVTITTTGAVSGGNTGIYAYAGTADLSLSLGGDVTGGTNGVVTVTQNGTGLTVASGQTISGGSVGIATMATNGAVTSVDNLNIFGTVNGSIMLFEGDDNFTLGTGGTVNGALRGGAGIDTLNFNSSGQTINNSGGANDAIAQFEIYNFNGNNFILSGLNTGLLQTNFNSGNNVLLGVLQSDSVFNASGASMQVGDGALVEGDFTNAGVLGVNAGGVGTFDIDGNFVQTGTGNLTLNRTSAVAADLITVSGDVNLAGTLNLNQSSFFIDPITLIDGTTSLTGTFDNVNGLLMNGLLLSQTIDYDVANADVNLVTNVADPFTITGLNHGQAAIATALTDDLIAGLSGNGNIGGLDSLVVSLGGLNDVSQLAQSLDALSPEIVDTGLQVIQTAELVYLTQLMDQSGGRYDPNCIVKTVSLYDPYSLGRQEDSIQLWGSIQFVSSEQDGGDDDLAFDSDGYEINTGVNGLRIGNAEFGVSLGFAEYQTDPETAAIGSDRVDSKMFRLAARGTIGVNEANNGFNGHLDGALGFGSGGNEIERNISLAGSTLPFAATGDPDVDNLTAVARFTLDGHNEKEWKIKPYVLASAMSTRQNSFQLGSGITAVNVEKTTTNRQTLGFGARVNHEFGETVSVSLDASSMHHFGETNSDINSSFDAAGASASSFNITGKDIRNQYLVRGNLNFNLGDDVNAGIGGFRGLGDIENFGAQATISKTF